MFTIPKSVAEWLLNDDPVRTPQPLAYSSGSDRSGVGHSARIRVKAGAQSFGAGWRESFREGYQGESVRSSSQRQSGA